MIINFLKFKTVLFAMPAIHDRKMKLVKNLTSKFKTYHITSNFQKKVFFDVGNFSKDFSTWLKFKTLLKLVNSITIIECLIEIKYTKCQ